MIIAFVATLAVLAPLTGAILASRAHAADARGIALSGLGIGTLSAAIVYLGQELVSPSTLHVGFAQTLVVDSFSDTVLFPLFLAGSAVLLSASRRGMRSSAIARGALMLAFAALSVLAGSVWLLLGAEIVGALVLANLASRMGRRVAMIYLLAAAGLIAVVGASLLASEGADIGMAELPAPALYALALAAVIRLGVVPFSTGITSTFEQRIDMASLLIALPFGGVAVLARIIAPAAAAGTLSLSWIVVPLVVAAPLAALLAISQHDLGRSVAYTLSALHALIVLGVVDPGDIGHLGGELLWGAALLTATGFAVAAALVRQRVGSPDLRRSHGLHTAMPWLSILFLLVGVAVAGAPGTLEFVAADILLHGLSVESGFSIALVVTTFAGVGYNAIRIYFRLFYGPPSLPRHEGRMRLNTRERAALIIVVVAVFVSGLAPGLIPLLASAHS